MSEEKRKVLDTFSKALEQLDEEKMDYIEGFGDGLAAKINLARQKQQEESDGDVQQR